VQPGPFVVTHGDGVNVAVGSYDDTDALGRIVGQSPGWRWLELHIEDGQSLVVPYESDVHTVDSI
jgi:hypothetical protein